MKHLIFILFFSTLATGAFAQEQNLIKSDTFSVEGNCNMCKKRIENAAYLKGVKRADWDKNSKKLVVIYRTDKASLADIQKKVAAVGHANEALAAEESAYSKLPACCQYKSDNRTH